ncbi:MAG TPA: VWA domain-containing protein [Anaerolineales bacterium]|nr:VWA domain-containing protein [Anaerolineales bacterium]
MSFIWPSLLLLLIGVPLLVLLYVRMLQRRKKFAARFGSLGLVHDARGSGPGLRRHIPAALFLGGVTILVTSLARPQATINLPRVEGTVILTFDVSGSMAADDLQPTRMEAAKVAATEFVNNQPASVSIGVVAFSDGGITVQAPTAERENTLATIERLVPRRGTSVGNGILVSLNTIAVDAGDPPILNTNSLTTPEAPLEPPQGWYPSAVVVLLSDGENNENPDPIATADLAADLGVRVYTVGVGSTTGAILDIEGFTVHSQLNEAMLQEIAHITGGQYYYAGSEEDLRRIYSDLEPKLSIKPEEIEITSIFAGFAILVFLVGAALSLLWFGRVL